MGTGIDLTGLGGLQICRQTGGRLWLAAVLVLGACATQQGPAGDADPKAVIGFNTAGERTLLLYPVRGGHLSSGFGPRLDPFTADLRFHEGIDLAAAQESRCGPPATA